MTTDSAATSRIAVTPATHEQLKEFRNGLNSSFDDAILLMLKLLIDDGEDPYLAGRRLREKLNQLVNEKKT